MSKAVPDSIRREAMSRDLPVTIRIGKSGVTENLVEEISVQLRKKSVVKIKVNRGIFDRDGVKQLWEYLSDASDSVLVFARGNVAVLWR
ncbi:MAG: RNA-binding protein [Euryarchaeota archaeon]|nr:RNA-binding protein [Euryarchaeota archaeon]